MTDARRAEPASPSGSAQRLSGEPQGDQTLTSPVAQGTSSPDGGLILDGSGLPMLGDLNQSTETVTQHNVDGEDTIMAEAEESSTAIETPAASEQTQPEVLASEPYAPDREIYIFLKTFDAESQTLVGVGTFLVKRTEKIAFITKHLLHLPSDTTYDHYIESHRYEAQKALTPDRVLEPGTFPDGTILIVQKRLSEKEYASPPSFSSLPPPNLPN